MTGVANSAGGDPTSIGIATVAAAMALSWLIPNQYQPWLSFYRESWMAVVLLTFAVAGLMASRQVLPWPATASVLFAASIIPLMQLLAGQQRFAGTAWTTAAYLFAAGLAVLAGARWAQFRPGLATDALSAAFLLGALLSVGLQVWQWLRLDPHVLWLIQMAPRGRPFGNLGQPNLLSLLLVWGLMGLWWFHQTRRVTAAATIVLAASLLFGLVMTQSRWVWPALVVTLVAAWCWRRPMQIGRPQAVAIAGLVAWYAALSATWISLAPGGSEAPRSVAAQTDAGPRPQGWAMVLDGLLRHPWAGYGWGQGVRAHHEVALDHAPLHEVYTYSHNIILDLLVWNGLPLGALLLAAIGLWGLRSVRRVSAAEDALLLLALAAFGVHALFEWPHAYAYFLLPAGVMVGVVDMRQAAASTLPTRPRWWGALALVVGALWLALIVRDYLQAEASQWALRFEQRRIGVQQPPSRPPDVVLLTQLRDFAVFVRTTPRPDMSNDEIDLMRRIAELNPAGTAPRHFAHALALNGRATEAEMVLLRLCRLSAPGQCRAARDFWLEAARDAPEMRAVRLPP
jgi:O-antigen ligase